MKFVIKKITYMKSEEYLSPIIRRLRQHNTISHQLSQRIRVSTDEYFNYLRTGAKTILHKHPRSARGGHNPFILAAATIIASDILLARHILFPQCYTRKTRRDFLTQRQLATVLNIAKFTIREHFLLLVKPLMESIIGEKELLG